MQFFKKYFLWIVGISLGALAGFLYWKFIGCASGSCAITSSPIHSTLYGALMGGLLGGTFKSEKTSNKDA